MPMLVTITGEKHVLQGLLEVAGLQLSLHSATDIGGDKWSVSAYATDEAAEHVRGLGCTVTVVMTSEEVRDAIRRGSGSNPPIV